ncbi:hypothetical protein LTS15_002208 [Exophiala xenobiotica]|nr:hypothetical protein LTS15_002208 [Exophiala xenobiotica]
MAIRGTRQAQTNRSRVHANGSSTPRSSFLFTSTLIVKNRSRRTCDEIGRWTFRRGDAHPGVLQRCADKGSRRRHNAYDTSKNCWELRNEHWLSIGEGIHLFHPTIAGYPHAKFPGVVVFSEIYQVTGPVARFARQIAGQGYIVAAPSSYHEFTGPEPLAYDGPGTDAGNEWKIKKKLAAYDEDAELSVSLLLGLKTCNGKVGATGMCLGGHLAYRCALDSRVKAAVCYFATDIHSHSLGEGKNDDSLKRAGDIRGELVMIFGKSDNHVPPEGRDLIRRTLHEVGADFSFYEVFGAQHAFIRDELSKGRYDPAISKVCFEMLLEVFERRLKLDLGEPSGEKLVVEDVC